MLFLGQDSACSMISEGNLIPVIAIGGGLFVGIVGIVFTTIAGIMKTRAREETKREIAAYVAEGTIDPDKAIAMLNAGRSKCGDDSLT